MRITLALGLCLLLAACPGPDQPGTPPAPDAGAATADVGPPATASPGGPDAGLAPGDGNAAGGATDSQPPAAPTDAATAATAAPGLARLAGRVSYPSEYLPVMRVCAIAAADPGLGHCRLTAENQPHFEIAVPAGDWWLLAWPQDTGTAGDPGLLSAASDCLGSGGVGCDDHALLAVTVAAGEVREGLDINDWYYDPQATPPPMPPRGETGE